MRLELLWNLRLLCERLADISHESRRIEKLSKTVASQLREYQIDLLELLEIINDNPPECVYDIGANVGTFTLLIKAIFPNAEIHAFEPHPSLYKKFLANTQHLSNIYFHPVAAGSKKSLMSLNVTNFVDASSLLEVTDIGNEVYNVKKIDEIKVQVEKLDDYVSVNKISLPDLIKLDIQGYELQALKGLTGCLSFASYVLSEVSFREIYHNQCLYHEIASFLADYSFSTYAFGKGIKYGVPLMQADILFRKFTKN
jgi:FkbM family methyltransferase